MGEFRKEEKKRKENTPQRVINRMHYLLTHNMSTKERPIVTAVEATLDNATAKQPQIGIHVLLRGFIAKGRKDVME